MRMADDRRATALASRLRHGGVRFERAGRAAQYDVCRGLRERGGYVDRIPSHKDAHMKLRMIPEATRNAA
jgi:hypothetical protein